jgi:hypothetical protein
MTLEKTVKLLIKSSNTHPYLGKLESEETLQGAIDLANLLKDFAKNGQTDEAMNLSVSHWDDCLDVLWKKLTDIKKTN